MEESTLIQKARSHVQGIFEQAPQKDQLHYHNWAHTLTVYNATLDLARHTSDIGSAETEWLQLAALFHDVAYAENHTNHEATGAAWAEAFLSKQNYPTDQIKKVQQLILATQMTHVPQSTLEKIIKDADLSHLASEQYLETFSWNLHKEVNQTFHKTLSKADWIQQSIAFFESHKYYTEYARETYKKGKKANLKKMNELLEEWENETKNARKETAATEKAVESMFKVALRNHMNLSQIADNKANTLISINSIIISIALSTLFPKLDANPNLLYPGIVLLAFSIGTIILSIVSTFPKTTGGMLSRTQIQQKKGNLIFFGNFHRMSLEDYEWGIEELMHDRDYLYKTLTRDLYFLGKVLEKKYNLLRYSYYSFVTGLVLSTVLFIISIYRHS